ncbi:MAG: hydrogenase maturation nickel metallochaperone HypA [Coriobacteriia bacterium]|nr:hydrogenase maturation nickel metallochaperone HypA [Coriobacteriia bacterium]
MHEGAVCAEVMDIAQRVARQNSLERIERIVVEVGPYSCLNEQELNFYFHVAQEGTCMEGAWISVERNDGLVGVSQMYVRSIEGE